TDGPRAILQKGTYQETNRKTGRVSVLYFDQTEVGLGGFLGHAAGNRPRQIEELYLDELLAGSGAVDAAGRAPPVAEAHGRRAEPFYSVAMAMIAAVCLITSGLPRQSQMKQAATAIAGAGLFVVLTFVLRSATQRMPALAPAVYLLPAAAIAICIWLLMRRKSMRPRMAA